MWLQVSRLSEITLADGCRLHPDPLNGRLPHGHDEINLKWPRQDRPPPQWWSLWRQCLCRSFSIDGKDTKLRQPLGEWHASALSTTSFTTHAAFVLTGTTNTLYQQVPGSSTFDTFPSQDNVIHRRLTRANMFAPLSNGRVDTLPPGAIPVLCTTLRQRRTNSTLGFRVRGPRFVRPTSELEPPVDNPSFQEFVAQQPPHIRRTMQHSNQDDIPSRAFADWLSAG